MNQELRFGQAKETQTKKASKEQPSNARKSLIYWKTHFPPPLLFLDYSNIESRLPLIGPSTAALPE
jgi:hypothetical protein